MKGRIANALAEVTLWVLIKVLRAVLRALPKEK